MAQIFSGTPSPYMVFSQNNGTQYRHDNTIILLIGTIPRRYPQNLGNPAYAGQRRKVERIDVNPSCSVAGISLSQLYMPCFVQHFPCNLTPSNSQAASEWPYATPPGLSERATCSSRLTYIDYCTILLRLLHDTSTSPYITSGLFLSNPQSTLWAFHGLCVYRVQLRFPATQLA